MKYNRIILYFSTQVILFCILLTMFESINLGVLNIFLVLYLSLFILLKKLMNKQWINLALKYKRYSKIRFNKTLYHIIFLKEFIFVNFIVLFFGGYYYLFNEDLIVQYYQIYFSLPLILTLSISSLPPET